MNTKILVTIMLSLLMVGTAAADMVYDTSVTLENKDGSWAIIDDDYSATVEYNVSGETFDWHAYGNVIEPGCYALIYYADNRDDKMTNWGGHYDGAYIGEIGTDYCSGVFDVTGSLDLDMNLPSYPDGNMDVYDYSGAPDYYNHSCGAKLWIVPCEDYDEEARSIYPNWNPDNYLFETDLIWYDDTGVNEKPYITTVRTDKDCYEAGEEITITVKVCDEDGIGDLEAMVVTGNFSEYGVEDIVTFTMVDCENGNYDCICREYEGTTIITKATVHECEDECELFMVSEQNGEIESPSYLIVATDPAGDYSDWRTCVDVGPGPCDHMELRNCGDCGRDPAEELHTVALTELSHCNTKDYERWWSHKHLFDVYMINYKVHVYDKYGNHISGIGCRETCRDCCDGFTATLTGEDASIKYCEEDGSKITIINDNNPGKTTLTVNCIGTNNIPALVQEVEFLMPVSALDVTANVDVVMNCCEGDSFVDIDAQIVDLYGNPILMPRVDVTLYVNGVERDTEQTDMNGVVSFFDISVEDPVDEVTIRAEAECRQGSLTLPVVEGPCYLEVTSDAEYMVNHDGCGEPDSMTVTVQLLNDSEVPFLYAGIDIDVKVLYDEQDCREGVSTAYVTDANGSVTVEVAGAQDNESVTICAKMPACDLRDSISVRIVEPELTELKLVTVEPIMIPFLPDDVQDYEVHCYNQRDLRMCCPDTTYEFTVDNETVCTWQDDYGYTYDGLDNRITAHTIGETDVNVSWKSIVDTVTVIVEDPCDYVTCEDKCFGYELWSQICVDGICVNDSLIEENCVECGYDPCEGVTCEDKCFGADLYSQDCDGGDCVQGDLIQANCPDCPGYDPCLNVECDGTICFEGDLYNMTCVDGACVRYMVIEEGAEECCMGCEEDCANMTICVGVDLYNMTCDCDECVADALIQANCPECGYVAPTPRRSGGGGGNGGTYPPGWGSGTNTTPTPTPTPEPTPVPDDPVDFDDLTIEDLQEHGIDTGDMTDEDLQNLTEEYEIIVDEDGNILPGFSGIFAVLGLLSIVYIMNRRRD